MARTKTERRASKIKRNTDDDNHNKKNLQDGLYVHSSPPKVVPNSQGSVGSANIREYLRGGNIAGLEDVVLEGHGHKLLNRSAIDPRVRAFLKTLPSFMSKIDLVHDATERGNLRDLKSLLDRRKLARSKDSQGLGLLHKAVLYGHADIVEYLVTNYPETATTTDHDGRTGLHYCAASRSADEMYSLLCPLIPDIQLLDGRGKTAGDYMTRPSDLKVVHKPKLRHSGPRKRSTPNKRRQKVVTPPKREGQNINGASIRIWIHDQDMLKLEMIVYEGQGDRLLKETSNNPKVRQFLNLVPRMMTKIKEVHQAAISGDMDMLEAKVDQPELLMAKDHNGLNPLHKSAALGYTELCAWIVARKPEAATAADALGRTPLFYAVIPPDSGAMYNLLLSSGADEAHRDKYKKTAEMYRNNPGEIDRSVVYELPAAPRSGGGALDIPFTSRGPSLAPSRQHSRAPSRNFQASRSLDASRRNSLSTAAPTFNSPRRSRSTTGHTAPPPPTDIPALDMDIVDMSDVTQDELDKLILDGDTDRLELVVLSGRGGALRGKSSWNEQVRKFLKKVPGYMEKIKSLHKAAGDGNLKSVRRLLQENPKMAAARGERSRAVALHYAASSGSVAATKLLHGVYPTGVAVNDKDGRNPAHWAAMSRSPGASEVYEMLQRVGAEIDAPDATGTSADDYFTKSQQDSDERQESPPLSRRPSPPSRRPSRRKSKPDKKPNEDDSKNSRNQLREGSPNRSRNGSRRGSMNNSETGSNDASRNNSRRNSMSNSRNGSRNGSAKLTAKPSVAPAEADAQMEEELQGRLKQAEDGDFDGLTEVILRGDGRLLVGRSSNNEEVQGFLDRVPGILESTEELHAAVAAGETRKVITLLDRRKKASILDTNHCNLLHKAVLYGHSDLVRYFLQSYPELLEQEDRGSRTPLHYAAVVRDGGHIYKILSRAGADQTNNDREGFTPQDYRDDNKILTQWDLKKELEEGIPLLEELQHRRRSTRAEASSNRPVTKGSEEPETLHVANRQGFLSRRNSNIGQPAYPGMWTEEGQYLSKALGDALTRGLSEVNAKRPKDAIATLALELYTHALLGAPTMSDKGNNDSAASRSSSNSQSSSIAMQTVFKSSPSGSAQSSTSNNNSVRHPRDKNGRNVLHIAAEKTHPPSAVYQLICAAGAPLLADRDVNYNTPRDLAEKEGLHDNIKEIDHFVCRMASDGNRDDLRLLMMEGYDHILDATDSNGRLLTEVAEKKKQRRVLDLLQQAGEHEGKIEWVQRAIRVGSLAHVQHITETEELALGKDTKGRTALHVATLFEEKDIMNYLATKFPSTMAAGDNLGRTPLHYAMAVEGVDEVAKVLVQAGATRSVKDLRGKLPSYYFMNRGEIVEMIRDIHSD